MNKSEVKELIKIILFIMIFWYLLVPLGCDGGWSVAGYEISRT